MPLSATALLVVSSLLMLWAAFTLAIRGAGTPLPVDPTREFVVTGPYAYMRHPFVAAAIGQIVAIGIAFGSVPVLVYATVLFLVWYYGIRPGEERALDRRFGDRVREYRRRVRGFRPF
jgi:protein-S-isoprenylcysteine O-methyltransferase Ste14